MELVKAKDSMVPGNPSAHEIAEGIHHSHTLTMILSTLVAALGIFLSWSVYLKKRISADAWAEKLAPYYNLSLNKYFIDENMINIYTSHCYVLRTESHSSIGNCMTSTSSMALAM